MDVAMRYRISEVLKAGNKQIPYLKFLMNGDIDLWVVLGSWDANWPRFDVARVNIYKFWKSEVKNE